MVDPRAGIALFLSAMVACTPSGGRAACGIVAVAGPTMLLDQFSVPGQTLGRAPAAAPAGLPLRFAAGIARRGIISTTDSGWLVGVAGSIPEETPVGFGVLIVDRVLGARGVLLYDGAPVRGAPVIGTVATATASVPLLGLEVAFDEFNQDACPFFPDSLR